MPSLNHINNRRHMLKHPSQGDYKKVLCVCTGGLLRSPTVALYLSQDPYNFNTRSCGSDRKYALIQLDEYLLEWADEIVCMNQKHVDAVKCLPKEFWADKKILNLKLSDDFLYRDEELNKIVRMRYENESSVQLS